MQEFNGPLPVKANFKMWDQAGHGSDNRQQQKDGHHLLSGGDILSAASTQDKPSKKYMSMKTILYYTPVFRETHFFGKGDEIFKNCPVHQCYATNDSALLPSISDFDALTFNFVDILKLSTEKVLHDLEKHRSPHQRYILINRESPRSPQLSDAYRTLNGKIWSTIAVKHAHLA